MATKKQKQGMAAGAGITGAAIVIYLLLRKKKPAPPEQFVQKTVWYYLTPEDVASTKGLPYNEARLILLQRATMWFRATYPDAVLVDEMNNDMDGIRILYKEEVPE